MYQQFMKHIPPSHILIKCFLPQIYFISTPNAEKKLPPMYGITAEETPPKSVPLRPICWKSFLLR